MNSRILSLVARRLVVMLTTLLIVSFIVFSATSLLPGDTATILLGQAATPEAVAGLRTAMHLD
ncbi:ABC transporter permease, partial [Xylella fastidiosa subsp. multiplex]|nr:ABC transporter permease [Xylella fastidiosa subsp. multiplex]